MQLKLKDVVDPESVQNLLDAYCLASGLTASIISLDREVIIDSRMQPICKDFHHGKPEAKKECINSIEKIHNDLTHGTSQLIYRCPHGLIKSATPLFVNGHHIANLFTGPFLTESPDAAIVGVFKQRSIEWGFDENAYLDALKAVPVFSKEKIRLTLSFLNQLSEMIGTFGYRHRRLTESRQALDDIHNSFKKLAGRREVETRKLTQIIEGNPIPTFVVGSDSNVTHWNRACERLTDISAEEMVGTDYHRRAFYYEYRELMADLIVRNAGSDEFAGLYGDKYSTSDLMSEGYQGEDFFPNLGEMGKWLFFTCAPLKDAQGNILGAIETLQDITNQKCMIEELRRQKSELDEKREYLEKMNQALKSLLDHREIENRAVEENLLVDLKRYVLPHLEALESCKISTDGKAYVNIIKTNVNSMISRFSKTIFSKYIKFTPTEIRIADFIRDGKNTKEIAKVLGLSPLSVKWHRRNIREKLELTNQKVNLYTYLNSLEK